MVHVLTESRGPLAVKNQQLCKAHGIPERFPVFTDRPFRTRYRRLLPPEYIRPQPSVDGPFVDLQRVFAQTEPSVKKSSIALICGVEMLKQTQQRGTIKTCQVSLHIRPCRLRFRRSFAHTQVQILLVVQVAIRGPSGVMPWRGTGR